MAFTFGPNRLIILLPDKVIAKSGLSIPLENTQGPLLGTK